jgi:hypothetical protein
MRLLGSGLEHMAFSTELYYNERDDRPTLMIDVT